MNDVSIVSCHDYDEQTARDALCRALEPIGGLDFVRPGMRVVIKANLVAAMRPQEAGTTHPALIAALTRLLLERGAKSVTVADSPGGLYNAAALHHVYRVCGLSQAVSAGALLNEDFESSQIVFDGACAARSFVCTSSLLHADAIVNFCKLKTHGMMTLSAAVKNLFGAVPGTMKPEYHFRFPRPEDFSDMLVDLNEYLSPALCLCDAVVAMEGNGPTAGKPRALGAILASRSPYALDLAAARMIGLSPQSVPTIAAAARRGLFPADVDALRLLGDAADLIVSDFEKADGRRDLQFETDTPFGRAFSAVARGALSSRPKLQKSACVGCEKCARICPAHAIEMKRGRPVIDRKRCIRCFCCQEFCPKGAMRVHRPAAARLLSASPKKRT